MEQTVTNFRAMVGPLLAIMLMTAGACSSRPSAPLYEQCQTCSSSCKGPDGCPRNSGCAECSTCMNRATQCVSCSRRITSRKPCEKAPLCHVTCKGCRFQDREGCDKTICPCGGK